MTNKCRFLIITGFLLSLSSLSQAEPYMFSECSNTPRVNEVERSSGYLFNKDCSVLYVLPPSRAKLKVSYVPLASARKTCEQMENAFSKIHAYSDLNTLEEMQKYIALSQKITGQVEKLTSTPVGRGQFVIDNGYKELVEAMRRANPSLAVEPVMLKQSTIYISKYTETHPETGKITLGNPSDRIDVGQYQFKDGMTGSFEVTGLYGCVSSFDPEVWLKVSMSANIIHLYERTSFVESIQRNNEPAVVKYETTIGGTTSILE